MTYIVNINHVSKLKTINFSWFIMKKKSPPPSFNKWSTIYVLKKSQISGILNLEYQPQISNQIEYETDVSNISTLKAKGLQKSGFLKKVNSAKRNAITKGIKDYTWFFEVFCKPFQRDSLFSESLLSYVPDIISTYEGCWDNLSNFSQFNKVKNSIVWRVALLVFQFDALFGILNSKWLCDSELECAVL